MQWIAIDGIDGAGKTTCAWWIKEYYEKRGKKVRLYRHPSSRRLGKLTRRCLQGSGRIYRVMASIMFLLDLLFSLCQMKGENERCDVTIFVRYLMTAAYLPAPLASPGYGLFALLLPSPDRLILVDVDPRVALERILARDHEEEMFETRPMLREVRRRMMGLLNQSWEVLDNNRSIEDCQRQLVSVLSAWER